MLRVEAVHKAFHHLHIVALGSGFDGVNVGYSQRHRLFAQYVLAVFDGPQCPLGMFAIRHRQIDCLNLPVIQQGF